MAKRYLVFFALALTFAALNVLLPRFFPALQQKPAAKQDDAAQKKIGAGLTPEQFQRKVDDGSVRHVGLAESITMIGEALGWKVEKITDEIQPKIAEARVASEFLAVDPGYVCGLIQDGVGYRAGQPVITLHMEAYLGAPESYDAVEITGSPALKMKIAGGVHGDIATTSIAVNSLPKILEVPPGLHTMRDMPIPSFFGGVR